MTDWASLQHAYGSAADVPALLAAAAADPGDRDAWDDLWSRLCHQGTVYSASDPAIPALTRMAVARGAAGYVEPLHLAAAIVASRVGGEGFEVVASRYGDELATLRDLAEQSLPHAVGPAEFVYDLQAMVAFEGAEPWGRELQVLADQEAEVECPTCGEQLVVAFDRAPPVTAALDDALPRVRRLPRRRRPAVGHDRAPAPLAVEHGRDGVADGLLQLFGTTTCPACGAQVDLPTALGRGDAR